MRHLFLHALPTAVLVVATGCDAVNEFVPFSGGSDKRQEEQRARQQAEAEETNRLADERAALAQHVAALSRALTADLESATKAVDEATADRTLLAERIRELSDANADKSRQVMLAAILADERVGELARKYMDRDFRLIRLEFIERVREALAARRAFDASRQRANGAYDAEVAAAKESVRSAAASVDRSQAAMRREIARLAKQERDLQRAFNMSSGNREDRSRRRNELNEVSDKLRRLQNEYDAVRAGRGAADDTARADRHAQAAIDAARRRRDHENELARSRFQGAKSPADVASEFEKETLGELERRIVGARTGHEERQRRLKAGIAYLASLADGVETLASSAMRKVRADADACVERARSGK